MIKKTNTSIFMVPTLGISKGTLDKNDFINGFLTDNMHLQDYEDAIYLLFKPDNLANFKEFLDSEYARTKQIVDDYDYEGGYVVLVYILDPKFKKDFDLVKSVRYSEVSEEFKSLFKKTTKMIVNRTYIDEISIQHKVFNKGADVREYWENLLDITIPPNSEVWGNFDKTKETLKL